MSQLWIPDFCKIRMTYDSCSKLMPAGLRKVCQRMKEVRLLWNLTSKVSPSWRLKSAKTTRWFEMKAISSTTIKVTRNDTLLNQKCKRYSTSNFCNPLDRRCSYNSIPQMRPACQHPYNELRRRHNWSSAPGWPEESVNLSMTTCHICRVYLFLRRENPRGKGCA